MGVADGRRGHTRCAVVHRTGRARRGRRAVRRRAGNRPCTSASGLCGTVARGTPKAPAELGVDVETLTPRLAAAAGAHSGVVVAWVDPAGIAASTLRIGDVIEALDDVPITSAEGWRVRAARVGIGDTLTLRVTRRGAQRIARLVIPTTSNENAVFLGLAMRRIARVGTEVTRVVRGSAAEAAGIAAGDVITAIGNITAPTPAQIASAFDAMDRGDSLIVAVRREGAHRVMALQR